MADTEPSKYSLQQQALSTFRPENAGAGSDEHPHSIGPGWSIVGDPNWDEVLQNSGFNLHIRQKVHYNGAILKQWRISQGFTQLYLEKVSSAYLGAGWSPGEFTERTIRRIENNTDPRATVRALVTLVLLLNQNDLDGLRRVIAFEVVNKKTMDTKNSQGNSKNLLREPLDPLTSLRSWLFLWFAAILVCCLPFALAMVLGLHFIAPWLILFTTFGASAWFGWSGFSRTQFPLPLEFVFTLGGLIAAVGGAVSYATTAISPEFAVRFTRPDVFLLGLLLIITSGSVAHSSMRVSMHSRPIGSLGRYEELDSIAFALRQRTTIIAITLMFTCCALTAYVEAIL